MSRLSVALIIDQVARAWGVEAAVILSDRRARAAARPRQVAMWLAAELLPLSLPALGRAFRRDHTTVMHAVEVVRGMRARDPHFATVTAEIRAGLLAMCGAPAAGSERHLAAIVAAFDQALRQAARRDPEAAFAAILRLARDLEATP